jgi:hypothetical protein
MTKDELIALADAGTTPLQMAGQAFLESAVSAFEGWEQRGAALLQHIADHLHIPVDDVQVSGSARLGFSLMHGNAFRPGTSDLDLALVNPALALRFRNAAHAASDGLARAQAFAPGVLPGQRTAAQVRDLYAATERDGMIRPDLMPDCAEKRDFLALFDVLARDYGDRFAEITGLIYQSREAFLHKQAARIAQFVGAQRALRADVAPEAGAAPQPTGAARPRAGGFDHAPPALQDDQVPATYSAMLRALVQSLQPEVALDCLFVTPVPGVAEGACDIAVYYRRRDDFHDGAMKRLWKISGEYARRGVALRYVPADAGLATVIRLTAAQVAANQRELGSRALDSSFLYLP